MFSRFQHNTGVWWTDGQTDRHLAKNRTLQYSTFNSKTKTRFRWSRISFVQQRSLKEHYLLGFSLGGSNLRGIVPVGFLLESRSSKRCKAVMRGNLACVFVTQSRRVAATSSTADSTRNVAVPSVQLVPSRATAATVPSPKIRSCASTICSGAEVQTSYAKVTQLLYIYFKKNIALEHVTGTL